MNVFDVTGDAARSMTAYQDASGLQLVTPYRYGLRTCRGTPGDARLSAYATVVVTTAAPPPAPSASRRQQPERIALLGQFGVHRGVVVLFDLGDRGGRALALGGG
ncbi:hypothetical protein ACH4A8_08415 [Streptomyces vietnamensis]|uniref:hypothetical protein n=1 Tax=Streptomyces vietnamensis TaxID=362257 RepID=UPI0037B85711